MAKTHCVEEWRQKISELRFGQKLGREEKGASMIGNTYSNNGYGLFLTVYGSILLGVDTVQAEE
jgi:hypothetical protein